jgi:hypothetical protein
MVKLIKKNQSLVAAQHSALNITREQREREILVFNSASNPLLSIILNYSVLPGQRGVALSPIVQAYSAVSGDVRDPSSRCRGRTPHAAYRTRLPSSGPCSAPRPPASSPGPSSSPSPPAREDHQHSCFGDIAALPSRQRWPWAGLGGRRDVLGFHLDGRHMHASPPAPFARPARVI